MLDLYASEDHHRFAYVFNVCADTAEVPKSGPNQTGDKCDSVTGPTGRVLTGDAPGYQIATDVDECYRLGDGAANREWSLIDDTNPAYGVALAYKDGTICRYSYKRRELRLMFICDDNTGALPSEEPVEETDECVYELYIRTAYGCPVGTPQHSFFFFVVVPAFAIDSHTRYCARS